MHHRNYKYDNIRGLAILLVVIAHLIVPFTDFYIYQWIYNLIAVISVSILFFVSGYLSKVEENTSIKAFTRILIPYIIFTILWILYCIFSKNILNIEVGSLPEIIFFTPTNVLWYLLSLFLMRLMLPILVKIKHIFLISIILALLIGIVDVRSFLSLSKTFCLLPSFLLGYYIKNHRKDLSPKFESTYNKLKGAHKKEISLKFESIYNKLKGIFLKKRNFFNNINFIFPNYWNNSF